MADKMDEGVVGGLVFNSRRDEQPWRKALAHGRERTPETMDEKKVETTPDGSGKFKVNYVFPDKKKIGNDRFETKAQARSYMKDLKRKGYHDVTMNEDVATNNAGGDPNPNIAGFDEPPVKQKKRNHSCTFAGQKVFEVDSDTFAKTVKGKKKYARYKSYMSLEDFDSIGDDIREYAKKNPRESIILKDSRTGRMQYLKGKK